MRPRHPTTRGGPGVRRSPRARSPPEDQLWLQANFDALYCGAPRFGYEGDIEEVLETKVQVRLVPGDYAIDLEPGRRLMHIAHCERGQRNGRVDNREGEVTVERSTVLGRDRVDIRIDQPLEDRGDITRRWLQIQISGFVDELASGVVLDGSRLDRDVSVLLCEGPCGRSDEEEASFSIRMDTCNFGGLGREVHRLASSQDEVTFEIDNAENPERAVDGQIVRAHGLIAGQAFSQTNFFDLAVDGAFGDRRYMVRFNEPVGDVCGLRLDRAHPWPGATWSSTMHRIRCNGTERTSSVLESDFEAVAP